ncbi:MAG: winged helix-turn-helix transcriptional regulator [Solirubrobacterales bacterium]|nr:winged helix-turn-helix transcriptional regulator [Solirubrobacterales bacterium]
MASADDRGLPAPLTLDAALCFAVYSASRALTGFYRPMLDELGITYPQYLVLLALWESDGPSVGALGERLALDYGTLSPLLKRLEAAGLVSRTRRREDERSVTVRLTDAGAALQTRASCIPEEVVAATGLDARSFAELRATLERLTANVNAADAQRRAADAA